MCLKGDFVRLVRYLTSAQLRFEGVFGEHGANCRRDLGSTDQGAIDAAFGPEAKGIYVVWYVGAYSTALADHTGPARGVPAAWAHLISLVNIKENMYSRAYTQAKSTRCNIGRLLSYPHAAQQISHGTTFKVAISFA
jgi:hypothetical protein